MWIPEIFCTNQAPNLVSTHLPKNVSNMCRCLSAGRNVFRDFLRCEYSEENILFWLACEELKNAANPEDVEEKARIIYEEYISILSPKEVRLIFNNFEIRNTGFITFLYPANHLLVHDHC